LKNGDYVFVLMDEDQKKQLFQKNNISTAVKVTGSVLIGGVCVAIGSFGTLYWIISDIF